RRGDDEPDVGRQDHHDGALRAHFAGSDLLGSAGALSGGAIASGVGPAGCASRGTTTSTSRILPKSTTGWTSTSWYRPKPCRSTFTILPTGRSRGKKPPRPLVTMRSPSAASSLRSRYSMRVL